MTTKSHLKIVVYQDLRGEWRWRLVSTSNGQIMADSAEGYASKHNVEDALDIILGQFEQGNVEVTANKT